MDMFFEHQQFNKFTRPYLVYMLSNDVLRWTLLMNMLFPLFRVCKIYSDHGRRRYVKDYLRLLVEVLVCLWLAFAVVTLSEQWNVTAVSKFYEIEWWGDKDNARWP